MKKNLLILFLLFLFSCKKDNGGETDNQLPLIKITAPTNNQAFATGQAITITATATDNKKLAVVHLEITNITTGAFITHEHYAANGSSYNLASTFVAQTASTYKIEVGAEDQAGNAGEAEITIKTN